MSMPFNRLLCLIASSLLAACQVQEADYLPLVPDIPVSVSTHTFSSEINSADFAEMVKVLASDEFEGRAPGTRGETLTVEYIRDQMQRIGLQPGNGDSWFQAVPMVVTRTEPGTILKIKHHGADRELVLGTDAVIGTRSGQNEVHIENSEIIFVGYGVDAPEHHWNDYAHGSWEGKTVIMLVNDPGFHINDEDLFEGQRMTWYGRWVYKFEEAARKGAAAALIIHDDAGASYNWEVVKHSWSGAQYDLPPHLESEPRLQAQGWVSNETARKLLNNSALNLDELYKISSQPDFIPIPLNATLSLALHSHIEENQSFNVIGVLPGNGRADEAVVYMAHWDHLGRHGSDESGDTIYNGAIDNASGVAGMLEIAGAMAAAAMAPQRSVIFMATTLEEAGLLGSQYYIKQPTFPLNKIAGVINIDAMSVNGRSRDVTVTGLGSSELEEILEKWAAKQGRYLHEEEAVQGGFYFRADHFSFAKAGVPAIYPSGGIDLIQGGMAAGRRAAQEYVRHRYHSPLDEYDASWNLEGVLQDLHLLHDVGWELANSNHWPHWYEGSPFKAKRDKMMPRPRISTE